MTAPCNYDGGDCLNDCLKSNCTQRASNGACDIACNSKVCGWDYGDCWYCTTGCSAALYNNNQCDQQCNIDLCNYDNGNCVNFI